MKLLMKLVFHFLLLFYSYSVCLSEDVPLEPEVDTPLGKVRGTWKTSLNGRKFASFEGIPYALPPVGDLRFEAPEPFGSWIGTWQATRPYTCLQTSPWSTDKGDEDCLYLNVYVPSGNVGHKKKFDVVVIIHGGAFIMGSGHMISKAEALMERDLIFVTINYRLGILGFLSTEDDVIPGNNGMKDQVVALQWVKDNIASFGGNPDTITINGISAGGASVHLHYFSPMSRGLFVRGFSQSGTALDSWVIRRNSLEKAMRLGALLECRVESTRELKKCLKQRPASMVQEKQNEFYGFGQMPLTVFGPVVERNSKNPFLAEEPYSLLKKNEVLDVPWIVSMCADEGLLPAAWYYTELEKIDGLWPEIAQYLLDYNDTLPISKRAKVAQKIKDYYLGPGEQIKEANFKKFTQIFTDRMFGIGAETSAKLQSKANKSPVYFYYFNYKKGENKMSRFFSDQELEGVAHGDDGIYFYSSYGYIKEFSKGDEKLKNACHDVVYSYATTGKPSFDGTDKWQPTKPSELTYLHITDVDDMKLLTVDTLTSPKFWRDIGLLEYESFSIKDEL